MIDGHYLKSPGSLDDSIDETCEWERSPARTNPTRAIFVLSVIRTYVACRLTSTLPQPSADAMLAASMILFGAGVRNANESNPFRFSSDRVKRKIASDAGYQRRGAVDRDHETFVVRPGLLRVVLLCVLLVVGATVFLFLAVVAGVIDVGGVLARGALLFLALFLAALAVYFLLALSTNAQRIEVGPRAFEAATPAHARAVAAARPHSSAASL